MALNQTFLQDIKKSFEDVHLDVKIYWIPPASLWNPTTIITLMSTLWFLKKDRNILSRLQYYLYFSYLPNSFVSLHLIYDPFAVMLRDNCSIVWRHWTMKPRPSGTYGCLNKLLLHNVLAWGHTKIADLADYLLFLLT